MHIEVARDKRVSYVQLTPKCFRKKSRERGKEEILKQTGNIWEIGVKGIWKFLILFCIFLKSDIILKQTEKNVLGTRKSV